MPVLESEKNNREAVGWITLALTMFLFPALFFLAVWFPIWIGLTERFP